ncbi:hypothetical protein EJB05_26329, partial [Eragrostis curvula]
MDFEPGPVPAVGDWLSSLCDDVLGRILSFLPSDEAARAAVLSRRWRHVFAAVDVISMKETAERPIPEWEDGDWSPGGYGRPEVDPFYVPSQPFVNRVNAAMIGRIRAPRAPIAPLRSLRVAFKEFKGTDARSTTAVDEWLSYATIQAGDELHVDLCFDQEPFCENTYALRPPDVNEMVDNHMEVPDHDDDDMEEVEDSDDDMEDEVSASTEETEYLVPSFLFRCTALRTLRIGPCSLNPPVAISLPLLDTLLLADVSDKNAAIKWLVSGCPRLADLTLQACNNVTKLSVPHTTRLRRLVLRCCHYLEVVDADLSELHVFEYRGIVPPPSFLRRTNNPSRITSCVLDFCGEEVSDSANLVRLRNLFHVFPSATHLQLKSARLGAGVGHGVFSSAPAFPVLATLRELELTGIVLDEDTTIIDTVTRILERTPSLEILSLFFMPVLVETKSKTLHKEDIVNEHWLKYDRYATLILPVGKKIRCLRKKMKEINLVHYQGALAQRMLAKFLLCSAAVVGEVFCDFAKGPLTMQTQLMEEIRGWVMNKSANMMFF